MMQTKIKDLMSFFNGWAPFEHQEKWDNSGLQIGHFEDAVHACLICLDVTEEIVEEAIQKKANVIISHHPLIFGAIKSITGKNMVERIIQKAILNQINIISLHTNLDHQWHGVNAEIGKRIGLKNLEILKPLTNTLVQLTYFVTADVHERVKDAIFDAGGGRIGNYQECSFTTEGTGTYMPIDEAQPVVGELDQRSTVEELEVKVLVHTHVLNKVLDALRTSHKYEEVAYFIQALDNKNQTLGSGMVGELEEAMHVTDFLNHLKRVFGCQVIRHTKINQSEIKKVAYCGGSGSFLLREALAQKADIFVTGDYKYHDFFDAENRIIIADIGHFESEQFTINLIGDVLTKNFSNFAIHLTGINTNPINYF